MRLPPAVGQPGQVQPPKGLSPNWAKITPKHTNDVLHCGDIAVPEGTKHGGNGQARVTGRIG